MKQKYRWLFGALALIASASILFGCKPNVPPSSEPTKITVTVQGDEKVTVQEPKTFQVDKGSVWKTVKEKVKVTYTAGYELSNWKLGNKDGTALTDAHVFTENTTVYAVSKLKVTTVQYDRLKDYLNSPTDPPAADGVYYIEVTRLTNTDLESSSSDTPSPLGQILKDCGKKVALKLSGDITVIGERAFYGCTELTSIIIPEEVTEISRAAFQNCTGLTNVTIPNSVTAIGKSAFFGCTKLTEIHLPASLNKIEENPFWGCENLTVITIAPTNRTYGCKDSIVYDKNEKKALFAAQGITGSITIPDGITAIGASAFSNRTKPTEIHLPASLNKIEGNPFSGCIHHTKLTVDAKNRKYKSENNMVYTSDMKTLVCAAGGLTNITIPNSVTAISEHAFYECLNLSNITIKSTGLTDITPETFKWIKDHARFTVKTEAVKTLLHTQGYIAEDRITVNPSL